MLSSSSSSSAPKRSSGPAGRGGRGGRGGGSSNRGGRFGGRGGQAGAAPPPAKRGRYDNSNNNNSKKKVGDGSNGEEMALDPKSKVLADAKALMESAFKTQEPEKRIEYVSKVYGLVKGRMLEVALKHDASRVIQMLLKFGNAHYRNLVIEELERKK